MGGQPPIRSSCSVSELKGRFRCVFLAPGSHISLKGAMLPPSLMVFFGQNNIWGTKGLDIAKIVESFTMIQ